MTQDMLFTNQCKRGPFTTPSQNPDLSKGVSISTGSTSSYSSTSRGADRKTHASDQGQQKGFIIQLNVHILSSILPSAGPVPTTSEVVSTSGSVSCSDLIKNKEQNIEGKTKERS